MSTAKGAEYFTPLDVLIGTLSSAHIQNISNTLCFKHAKHHTAKQGCDLIRALR